MKKLHIVSVTALCILGLVTLSAAASLRPATVAWENTCESATGWLDNDVDPNIGALVTQFEPSVVQIKQDGAGTWGKVAYRVAGINLGETPILETQVNMVDVGSAFQVGVATLDWSDLVVVIDRSSADGVQKGDISKAIKKESKNPKAWEEAEAFYVVVIVEGKSKASYFDTFRIRSKD